MNKSEYLQALTKQLGKLPESERQKTVEYYDEWIADKMEDSGKSEEEVLADMESPDAVARKILAELPITAVVKEKISVAKKNINGSKNKALLITLLILASPLLLAAGGVVFSLVIAALSVVFAVAVSAVSLVLGGLAAVVVSFILPASFLTLLLWGSALVGTGLILAYVAYALCRGVAWASKRIFGKRKKEEENGEKAI